MKLWIARDLDRDISVYYEKPSLDKLGEFWGNAPFGMRLSNDSFPEVTFENSPQEVELELRSDYQKEINKMKKLYYELHNNDLLKKCKYYKDKFCKLCKKDKTNKI